MKRAPYLPLETQAMMFVDGENLSIRYAALLGGNPKADHVRFEPDVFVWSDYLITPRFSGLQIVRKYYYTSTLGDRDEVDRVTDKLKGLGIEAPRVFHKKKGQRAKRVDITLAVDMLSLAHNHSYEVAILVAGDGDYVPLVEEIQRRGRRVLVWFPDSDGLSPHLRRQADHFFDLGLLLFSSSTDLDKRWHMVGW